MAELQELLQRISEKDAKEYETRPDVRLKANKKVFDLSFADGIKHRATNGESMTILSALKDGAVAVGQNALDHERVRRYYRDKADYETFREARETLLSKLFGEDIKMPPIAKISKATAYELQHKPLERINAGIDVFERARAEMYQKSRESGHSAINSSLRAVFYGVAAARTSQEDSKLQRQFYDAHRRENSLSSEFTQDRVQLAATIYQTTYRRIKGQWCRMLLKKPQQREAGQDKMSEYALKSLKVQNYMKE